MRILVLVILAFFPLVAYSDQPRHQRSFVSENKKYELRLADGFVWQLLETETKREVYRLDGNLGLRAKLWAMSALVSDDGNSIVVLDDYSEQDIRPDPEVLFFFAEGKKIKGYKASALIDSRFIQFTASHFRWVFLPKSTSITASSVNFTTYEMNSFFFNSETGELLKKSKDEALPTDATYVYGTVTGLGGKQHQIEVECVIYGNAKKGSIIKFESLKQRWEGTGFNESLVISNGKLIARKGVIFNACEGFPN